MTDQAPATPTPASGSGARGRLPIALGSGRTVVLELPLPISAEELLHLISSLPAAAMEANIQYLAATGQVAGTIAMPGGGTRAILSQPPGKGG